MSLLQSPVVAQINASSESSGHNLYCCTCRKNVVAIDAAPNPAVKGFFKGRCSCGTWSPMREAAFKATPFSKRVKQPRILEGVIK